MGSLGFWEIFALAVLALMIFGPDRLPGMARNAGKMISGFRREANKTVAELKEAAGIDEDVHQLVREAKQVKSSLADVRKTATSALMGTDDGKTAAAAGPTGLPAPFDADGT